MNFFSTLLGWGRSAWNAITGLPGDVSSAVQQVWHYVTSLGSVLSWLVNTPLGQFIKAEAQVIAAVPNLFSAVADILRRIYGYIWANQVVPVRAMLLARIAALRAWTAKMLQYLTMLVWQLYYAGMAYTRAQVGIERQQRIAAVAAEHASMLANVKALDQLVQREAATGYNTGSAGRAQNMTDLLEDIESRTPLLSDLESALVNGILDLAEVDDPLLRFGLGKLLAEVIGHAGVDAATGDLVSLLFGSYAAQPKASDLTGSMADAARRITALETWVSQFMTAGGPEVEQAGRTWKDITGLAADAAILADFALMTTDPQAWSTAVSDTLGTVISDTLTGVTDLLKEV